VSNLLFEIWWTGSATAILTTQPHVDSQKYAMHVGASGYVGQEKEVAIK
jgi:hypothetical protein